MIVLNALLYLLLAPIKILLEALSSFNIVSSVLNTLDEI